MVPKQYLAETSFTKIHFDGIGNRTFFVFLAGMGHALIHLVQKYGCADFSDRSCAYDKLRGVAFFLFNEKKSLFTI